MSWDKGGYIPASVGVNPQTTPAPQSTKTAPKHAPRCIIESRNPLAALQRTRNEQGQFPQASHRLSSWNLCWQFSDMKHAAWLIMFAFCSGAAAYSQGSCHADVILSWSHSEFCPLRLPHLQSSPWTPWGLLWTLKVFLFSLDALAAPSSVRCLLCCAAATCMRQPCTRVLCRPE